ncbi:MAG: hypothetical protein GYA24_09425, partial [Candidatus Lokiarchaeota archaeon]|nr:hypothetical protein [Candidatus Lokiarchaeota archaeon]
MSSTAASTSARLAGSRLDPMAALVQLMKGQAIASMVAFIACGGLTFAFILVYYAYMAFIGGLGACLTNFLLALAITKLPPPRFVPANLKDTPAPPALIVMIVMAAAGGVLMATGRYYDYWFGSYVYIPVFFLGLGLLVAAAPWILLNSIAARLKAQVAGPNRLGAISGGSGTAAGSAPGPAIATAGGMATTATAIANATPSTSAALTPRERRIQRAAERAAARAARTGRGAGTPAEAGAGQSTSQGQAHAQAQGQATPGSGGSRDADAAKASMQSPTSKGNRPGLARHRHNLVLQLRVPHHR